MMEIKMTRNQNYRLENGVNPNLLQDFWLQLRCTGPDVFSIQKYDGSTTQEIQNGWMPQKKETDTQELRRCVGELSSLKASLAANFKKAFSKIKSEHDFHEENSRDNHCYCIYCKCDDGIIGVGWRFRDGDLAKAKMMAAFTLYAYGLQSADSAPVLWDACYRHLPFATNMNLSVADRVFMKYAL